MKIKSPQDYLNPHNKRWDDLDFLLGDDGCAIIHAPTSLTVTEFSSTRMDLTWIAPVPAVTLTGYKIERQVDDGAWSVLVADTGNLNLSYSDSTVVAGTINGYRITALNGVCTSTASTMAEAYAYSNADARTGYNAVVTGNGGAIDYSIYDTAPRTVKVQEGVDNLVVTAVTDSWWTTFHALYVFFGGSAGAHAINFKNAGTDNLVFINSPTQGKNGVTLNGTTQYMTCGIGAGDMTVNNLHLAVKMINIDNSQIQVFIGAQDGAATRTQILQNTANGGEGFFDAHNTTTGRLISSSKGSNFLNKWLMASRRTSTDAEWYIDGISDITIGTGGGAEATSDYFIGAQNNGGSPAQYTLGSMIYCSVGTSMTGAMVTSWYNAMVTFNAILGR